GSLQRRKSNRTWRRGGPFLTYTAREGICITDRHAREEGIDLGQCREFALFLGPLRRFLFFRCQGAFPFSRSTGTKKAEAEAPRELTTKLESPMMLQRAY